MIKTHLWKASIINYEIAQELSLFSIIMFWVFWRQKILDFQKYDHHSTGKIEMAEYWKQIIRYIIIYWANTVAPVYMIIDFLVTKIVFKFRHLVFCILIAGGYLALFAIGYQIINDSDPFPLNKDNIYTVYTPVAFVGILLNHFVFTLISKAKWMYTKDPSEYGGEDSEVEKIIEKYKHFVKKRAIAYNSSIRSSIIDEIRATDLIKAKDIEFKFMREVVYNYLDMDVKRKRVNWSKVGKIKDIIEESKENMEESHIE